MKKRMMALLMAGTMMLGALAGCGSGSSAASDNKATDSNTSGSSAKGKYGVFIAQNGNEFTMTVAQAAKARGEELGYEVNVFDGQSDQDKQVSQIETCITEGYKGLIVEPVSNDGLNSVLQEAVTAGIPVVTVIQTCAIQDKLTAFVGADYEAASYMEAKSALEAIGGKGNICILKGQMGTSGETVCSAGFERALKEFPNVKVLEAQAADWKTDKALQITETWLQKYSNINAILAEDDPSALGAVKACTDAGQKNIVIIGRNGDTDALQAIKNGQMLLTVQSDPKGMGSKAADVLTSANKGEKTESKYSTENVVITKDNVDKYLTK